MNRLIRTYPHTNERGNRLWKSEACERVCIQGNRESHILDICDHYENRMAGPEDAARWGVTIGDRMEGCSA